MNVPPLRVRIIRSVKTFDISVRISRVGERSQDRLYSDENQEEACRHKVADLGGSVGLLTVEKNVSGGKAAKSRDLEKLILRVEAKESSGIVVYDFSRFSREEPFKAMMTVGRIHNAGGVVIGVADNYDSSAPMAVVMTAIYAEQAHNYLKVTRERSNAGVEAARAKGIYIGRNPQGYVRDEHGALVHGEHALLIDAFFKRKLAGDSYADLVRLAAEHGMKLTVGGMRTILANRVYIGESVNGPSPALTDKETFERVQAMKTKRKATGVGAQTLAQGIAHCANCGKTLIVTRTSTVPIYYCRGLGIDGCNKRGNISVHLLDDWIDSLFRDRAKIADRVFRAYSDEEALAETGALMDAKRYELDTLKKSMSLISTLGIEEFEKMVAEAQAAYDISVAAYAEAKASADLLGGMTRMLEMWEAGDLTLDEKRRLLPKVIGRVEVGPGRVGVDKKCRVIFADGTVLAPDDAGAILPLVQDRRELTT